MTPALSSPRGSGVSGPAPADKRSRHNARKVALAKKDTEARELAKKAYNIAKKAHKEAKKRRKSARAHTAEDAGLVERADDSEEVRQIKKQIIQMRAERDAAREKLSKVRAASAKAEEDVPDFDSLARPSSLSKITIHELRELLHLAGDAHDDEWNEIRASVRHHINCGDFDPNLGYKGQNHRKITETYAAIEEDCPVLRRCRNSWGAEYLVKDAFAARNTYQSCMKNPNTYRYRKRNERRACRAQSCSGQAHDGASSEDEVCGYIVGAAESELPGLSD